MLEEAAALDVEAIGTGVGVFLRIGLGIGLDQSLGSGVDFGENEMDGL